MDDPGWKGSRECDMNTREIHENGRASRKLSRALSSVSPRSRHNMLCSRQSGNENTRGKKIRTLKVLMDRSGVLNGVHMT